MLTRKSLYTVLFSMSLVTSVHAVKPLTIPEMAEKADAAIKKEKRAERPIVGKCKRVKKEVDALNSAIAEKNKTVAGWMQRNGEIDSELAPKDLKMTGLQADKSAKLGEIDGLNVTRSNIYLEYNKYLAKQTGLKNDIEKQITAKEAEVDAALDAQVAAARPLPTDTTYEIYQARQAASFKAWRDRYNELECLNGKLEQVLGTLNTPAPTTAEIDSDIASKQSDLTGIQRDIDSLQLEIDYLKKMRAENEKKIFNAKESIGGVMPKSLPPVCAALVSPN